MEIKELFDNKKRHCENVECAWNAPCLLSAGIYPTDTKLSVIGATYAPWQQMQEKRMANNIWGTDQLLVCGILRYGS